MINRIKDLAARPLLASRILRRHFSVKGIYSSFPATLMYYSPRQKLGLYDARTADDRPDENYDDGVALSNDLVFPGVYDNASNGATMWPNTFLMQEIFRRYYDEGLDREEDGQKIDTPYIFSVPKGTPIPSHLILLNESMSKFSLQPSRGMPLQALNKTLDEFYSKHATKETADEWLGQHPYHLAIDDYIDSKWMAE
ncbi:hypothetical protein F4678DRAFT_460920 [Xylaria arbuscula]|nr:hypothetical protein F4678DRAFT_460920 [Xylaria arbuscula]